MSFLQLMKREFNLTKTRVSAATTLEGKKTNFQLKMRILFSNFPRISLSTRHASCISLREEKCSRSCEEMASDTKQMYDN